MDVYVGVVTGAIVVAVAGSALGVLCEVGVGRGIFSA